MRLPFIEVGQIVTTHGVRGEVKLLPWTDGPEFLLDYKRVRIGGTEYKIESCRVQKTCNLLKLAGVDTVEQAQMFRGKTAEIYREDVKGDVLFAAELLDMEVFAEGKCIGVLTEVLDYPGNQVYTVKGEHSYMIPAVRQFVQSIDLEKNRMEVTLLEGMRDDEN